MSTTDGKDSGQIARQAKELHTPGEWSRKHHARLLRAEQGLGPIEETPEYRATAGPAVGGDMLASRLLDEALQRGNKPSR